MMEVKPVWTIAIFHMLQIDKINMIFDFSPWSSELKQEEDYHALD